MSKIIISGISEENIRVAKWMLKSGKTKKAVCEQLGIAYNTARLAKIIADFDEKVLRIESLKKHARTKPIDSVTENQIVKEYTAGQSIASIADSLYLTPTKVKNVLIKKQIPIRGRGKFSVDVSHITQDLNYIFNKGEKVFSSKENAQATIIEVYDESYIEKLKDGKERFITNPHIQAKNEYEDTKEGIHYYVYWSTEVGEFTSRKIAEAAIHKIENFLEEYGQEYYKIWVEKKFKTDEGHEMNDGYFCIAKRVDLFPITNQGV